MSAAFKFSVQPFIDNVLGYLDADYPGTETDDVGIVMHLGKSGTVAVVSEGYSARLTKMMLALLCILVSLAL